MRLKHSYLTILLTIGVSCNDRFLEVLPRDQVTVETFFKTGTDALQAATTVYDYWGGQGNGEDGFGYSFFLYFADTWTDDAYSPLDGYWYQRFQRGNLAAADAEVLDRWSEFYFIIRRANWFLHHISQPVMQEELRLRLTAEVRFIRAFQYFMLYQTWGEVPLVSQPLTLEELKIGRAEPGETVSFILEDLDYAIANLPQSYDAANEGRITRGAALGLKARTLLYEGRWQEAAVAAREVMDSGIYSLFQTAAGDGYRQLFKTENENNAEVIIDRENAAVPNHGNQLPRLSALKTSRGGDGFIQPSQSLVDAYEAYDATNDQLVAVDAAHEFVNRDPRLTYTIACPGSVLFGQALTVNSAPLTNSRTRYGTIKFIPDEFNGNNGGLDYGVNHILMRYAEILLTYAEAKIEANEIDQSVVDAINEVRARAWGAAPAQISRYPEITMGSQETLRDIVRKERRVELALEGLRWFDIKRWGIGSEVMGKPVYGARIDGHPIQVSDGGTFDSNRDYLRPVPDRERQLIGRSLLGQNPGYN